MLVPEACNINILYTATDVNYIIGFSEQKWDDTVTVYDGYSYNFM